MGPIINSQLPEFKVQAFQNGTFKTVTNEDVKGKWAVFFSQLYTLLYQRFCIIKVLLCSVVSKAHFVKMCFLLDNA